MQQAVKANKVGNGVGETGGEEGELLLKQKLERRSLCIYVNLHPSLHSLTHSSTIFIFLPPAEQRQAGYICVRPKILLGRFRRFQNLFSFRSGKNHPAYALETRQWQESKKATYYVFHLPAANRKQQSSRRRVSKCKFQKKMQVEFLLAIFLCCQPEAISWLVGSIIVLLLYLSTRPRAHCWQCVVVGNTPSSMT
jgi:hypothetical protein